MKKFFFVFLIFSSLITGINAQVINENIDYVDPQELVTLSETLKFQEALEILSRVSEKMAGKRIVATVNYNQPIGLSISSMNYRKALMTIVQFHGLKFEERENVIAVISPDKEAAVKVGDDYAPLDQREVKISAIFFEANVTEMRERGINWQYILTKSGLNLGGDLISAPMGSQSGEDSGDDQGGEGSGSDFSLSADYAFKLGEFAGNAAAVFRFFESENLGDVIARPSITVRDKTEGKIQIGSDYSIKQRDFAGNIIDVFVSTGTIIKVIPYLYSEDGVDYILLKLDVERSSGNPGTISTEIRKTNAKTEVLMLNGEETVIGGLFVNEVTKERRGIPFLKDLPWWVLGIRYLTGYNLDIVTKREVIILIKAEIVPSLRERYINNKQSNPIKDKIEEDEKELLRFRNLQNN